MTTLSYQKVPLSVWVAMWIPTPTPSNATKCVQKAIKRFLLKGKVFIRAFTQRSLRATLKMGSSHQEGSSVKV